MKISAEKLSEIINRCDPERIKKSFSSAGRCGNEGIFKFCQYMKQEDDDPEKAMPYIKQWYEKWRNNLVDETGHRLELEDVYVQAKELWDRIAFGIGGQLVVAIENAKKRQDETIPELGDYGGEPERLLAIVCWELNVLSEREGKETIFLSEYSAAEILGLDRMAGQKRGRRTLKVFILKGILSVAKLGNAHKATRFFYTGSPPIKN